MGSQTIHLTEVILGLRPYVLIEFFDGGEDEEDLRADVRSGAGIGSVRDIRAALELALESLPPDGDSDSDGAPVVAAQEGLPASTGEVAPPAGDEINSTT